MNSPRYSMVPFMSKPKSGQYFTCIICEKEFYRSKSQIALGATKTCSKKCLSEYFRGEQNPFWGKTHSEETKEKVSKSRKGKCIGNQNAKGYKHSNDARKKISNASQLMWKENRDKMINSLPRGEKHIFHKNPEIRRHRKHFTPLEHREWIGDKCAYCGTTKKLELDHIIPIFDGGTNDKSNAQTLCRSCNVWKVYAIDLPRYNARLGSQGGQS